MKTNTILSLLFLFLATNAQAQLKPIDFPRFSSKSSDHIEITRIEQNDTATVLFMEAYNRPNYSVRISSGTTLQGASSGKTYKLRSSKGFQLDQQINMPASGNVSFQLFFEPLNRKEQKISFITGQQEGDYVVKDIELNEDYKKAPIHCHISGTVINKPQLSRLILCTDLADPGTSSWISIPVHNGTFNYDLYTNIEEKYRFIYWDDYQKYGILIPAPFFAENGNIEMTLYPYSKGITNTYDIKTTKAAIKKDGYPWMNLIELNDKAQIWSKYGIPNAAGSTFLIDNTGRILAINPSAKEAETILEQTL